MINTGIKSDFIALVLANAGKALYHLNSQIGLAHHFERGLLLQ
jgi:hypothetical protein